MKTLVIPDIHGKPDLLLSMLKEHKDADEIIQLGDLANCVWRDAEGDLDCISIAREYNINVLVGNHEHPYFGGPKFNGFEFLPEVREGLLSLNMLAAVAVGDTLITHAGLHPSFVGRFDDAKTTATGLNRIWKNAPNSIIFSMISYRRGGAGKYGGILWRDYSENVSQKFPQVFGHTKDKTVRKRRKATCIDCEKPYVIIT